MTVIPSRLDLLQTCSFAASGAYPTGEPLELYFPRENAAGDPAFGEMTAPTLQVSPSDGLDLTQPADEGGTKLTIGAISTPRVVTITGTDDQATLVLHFVARCADPARDEPRPDDHAPVPAGRGGAPRVLGDSVIDVRINPFAGDVRYCGLRSEFEAFEAFVKSDPAICSSRPGGTQDLSVVGLSPGECVVEVRDSAWNGGAGATGEVRVTASPGSSPAPMTALVPGVGRAPPAPAVRPGRAGALRIAGIRRRHRLRPRRDPARLAPPAARRKR